MRARSDHDVTDSSLYCPDSMLFYAMAILAACLIMPFMSGAEQAPCPSGAVVVDVYSAADVQNLTSVLACAGGYFNITWHHSLTIEQRIKVSDNKNVTVTGTGVRSSLRGALRDDNGGASGAIVKGGRGTGIFAVSNSSTLRLNHLVLEGGSAETGGAVDVDSSSSLFVFGCTFTNNSASKGGEIIV